MNERTTAGLVGDFLANLPASHKFIVKDLAQKLQRERSGVKNAVDQLQAAGAISAGADPTDRRRTVAYMTAEQAQAWRADDGATAAVGINLVTTPTNGKAAAGAIAAAVQRRSTPLRFGLWNDGALMIDGLARGQLTLSPAATANLAHALAALPEGALHALIESPLKPSFSLEVDGREHPMDSEQTAALVAYVEALPARVIRPVARPDNRVHRTEVPADAEGVLS